MIREFPQADTMKTSKIASGIFWEATESVAQFAEHAAYASTGGFEWTPVVGIRRAQAGGRWGYLYVVLKLQ